MATATTEPGAPKLPIRRNIALLSAAVAANTAMLQLIAAGALAAASCGFAALGSAHDSALIVLAGRARVGISNGATMLARTAGGDMYPPERRARGIALVLFGAILGPVVFGPVPAGRELDGDTLAALCEKATPQQKEAAL